VKRGATASAEPGPSGASVISLSGVGKRYVQLHEQGMLLKSVLPGRRARKTELWALRDVTFEVEPGETLGILGRNGAGKTSLLRLMAGVSRPSEGRVCVGGRVAPLISVGVGFHQEMSGRENILINGMLLGLTKRQVAERFDDIVAFAEIEDLIDTPVKFYSSGQYMRLGFAAAVHTDPDILLVDEVLAVGDLAFQLKCFERMREMQRAGTTIVLVSHFLHAIRLLCPRALLLHKGRLEFDGAVEDAIDRYHAVLTSDAASPAEGRSRAASNVVSALSRTLEGADGPTHHPRPGDELRYRVTLQFHRTVDSPFVVFNVTSEEGTACYSMQSAPGQQWCRFEAGDTVDVEVAFRARLGGGTYRLSLAIADQNVQNVLANRLGETAIYLAPRPGSLGTAELEATITAIGRELSDYGDIMMHRPPAASPQRPTGSAV
jgi:ABC-type polysaccharide/polyol phosphate transport system ATPase subunit